MDIRQKRTKNKKPYRIHKIQSTEFKRLNNLKCSREDTSVPLTKGEESNHKWRGREGLGRESGWDVGEWEVEGNLIWYWVRKKD